MSRNGRIALRVSISEAALNDKHALFAWWRTWLIPAWLNRPEGVTLELVFPREDDVPEE